MVDNSARCLALIVGHVIIVKDILQVVTSKFHWATLCRDNNYIEIRGTVGGVVNKQLIKNSYYKWCKRKSFE